MFAYIYDIHVRVYIYVYTFSCEQVYVYECIYANVNECVVVFLFSCTNKKGYMHVCTNDHAHVCMYTCICTPAKFPNVHELYMQTCICMFVFMSKRIRVPCKYVYMLT